MSRRLRFVVAAVGLIVIVVLAWMLLLSPLRADIASVSDRIATEQTRLATAQAKLAQAEMTRAEGKINQARLLELAKMVPFSSEVPSLLLQIQDLADQAGIDFMSITPGARTQLDGYQVLPLSLEFTGTFFDLSDFVWRAEQLVAGPGRLLALKQLDLDLGGGSSSGSEFLDTTSPVLRVNMTIYAFASGGGTTAGAPIPVTPQPGPDEAALPSGQASGS